MARSDTQLKRAAIGGPVGGDTDHPWEGYGRIDPGDHARMIDLVGSLNAIYQQLRDLPAVVRGDHLAGHVRGSALLSRATAQIAEVVFANGVTAADLIKGDVPRPKDPVQRGGRRLVKVVGTPMRPLAYVRCLPAYHGNRQDGNVITDVYAGGEVLRHISPLTPHLLGDGMGIFIDCRELLAALPTTAPAEDRERRRGLLDWEEEEDALDFARLVGVIHQTGNCLGIVEQARLAAQMGLRDYLAGLALVVFLTIELLGNERAVADGFRDNGVAGGARLAREAGSRTVRSIAFRSLVPEQLAAQRPGSIARESAKAAIASVDHVVGQIGSMLEETTAEVGGPVPRRTLRYLPAALGDEVGKVIPEPVCRALRAANSELAALLPGLYRGLLATATAGPECHTRRMPSLQPISVADLGNQGDPVRLYAAAREFRGAFTSYIVAHAGLWPQDDETSLPAPPMPLPAPELGIEHRVQAASASVVVARAVANGAPIPPHVLEFRESPAFLRLPKEQQDAEKNLHGETIRLVKAMVAILLAFGGKAPGNASLGALLAYWEARFEWAGGTGINSIRDLIFPCLFFMDAHFHDLLRFESPSYRASWLAIRDACQDLASLLSNASQDFTAMGKQAQRISQLIRGLNARMVEATGVANSPPPAGLAAQTGDLFAAPPATFGDTQMDVPEAQAPVCFELVGPGNPAALDSLVAACQPHIRRLQHITVSPLQPAGVLVGRRRYGTTFDPDRLPFVALGEDALVFSSIDRQLQPLPSRKAIVRVFVDYSGSMGTERLAIAKSLAVVLSLGLRSCNVTLDFYVCDSSCYRISRVYDTRLKAQGGKAALSAIANPCFAAGRGWNPDAACLLGLKKRIDEELEDRNRNLVVFLGDMEFCGSLREKHYGGDAVGEVTYALARLREAGHAIIIGRVGRDDDPVPQSQVAHDYLHLPERLDASTMDDLARLVKLRLLELWGVEQ